MGDKEEETGLTLNPYESSVTLRVLDLPSMSKLCELSSSQDGVLPELQKHV